MKVSGEYFDRMYADAADPWQLASRWYEQRKYAITMSLLPARRYGQAFEPGCSIGTLTELLAQRCDHITSMDVAAAALSTADGRLTAAGCRNRVSLVQGALDEPWPVGPFDLVVLSEVAYYLDADLLAGVLRRECPRWADGATLLAAHWRHPVADYPITGDQVHEIISATSGLISVGRYCDDDVVIEVFDTGGGASVAAREAVPGAR